MPPTATAPLRPYIDPTPTPQAAVEGQGWMERAQETVGGIVTSDWAIYGVAAGLAVLLALSLRSRRKRTKVEAAGQKAALSRTDLAITRITGLLATAVVALGAWKVFGDVLHLHPFFRAVLFFFAEAQIVAAWRRVRRHIHRHASLGPGIRTIYGIAFGSALVAAFDADSAPEIVLRFFAAGVAAYMIAEELAEELDIHLTANPHFATGKPRRRGRIKWAFSPERILVWLRLAEPTERTVEQVERQRRVAQLARTGYRLHLLEERGSWKWRIWLAEWRLRRQTESANEHLALATDAQALSEVRAQLALLYGAKAGMSRGAVSDLNPLRPAPRLAISATPFMPPSAAHGGEPEPATAVAAAPATVPAGPVANEPVIEDATTPAIVVAESPATDDAIDHDTADANRPAVQIAARPTRKPAKRRAPEVANDGTHPTAIRLANLVAKYPTETNAQLAKRMRVGERTISRYRADAEAYNLAKQQPAKPAIPPTFELPKKPATAGVNGSRHALEEIP